MTLLFDDLADAYDAMIDWPKRLAREEPFYRRLFERHSVARVLDAACGTGRHAAMFHDWGLHVEASDLSPTMIGRARARFGESPGLRWVVRGFDQPIAADEPFDAVVCAGNSLPLAPDAATVRRAIAAMTAALRSGGVLMLHMLNLWRLPDGPCVWQKCRRANLPQGEALIVKGVHRSGNRGFVELIVAELPGGALRHSEAAPFLGLEASELEATARDAGAGEICFFGGYGDEPYDRLQSVDLILTAKKR